MGELCCVLLIVLGLANPDFELDGLLRPVDGAIGDDERLHLVVAARVYGARQTFWKPRNASRPSLVVAIVSH